MARIIVGEDDGIRALSVEDDERVQEKWFFDSIEQNKLLPFEDYSIS